MRKKIAPFNPQNKKFNRSWGREAWNMPISDEPEALPDTTLITPNINSEESTTTEPSETNSPCFPDTFVIDEDHACECLDLIKNYFLNFNHLDFNNFASAIMRLELIAESFHNELIVSYLEDSYPNLTFYGAAEAKNFFQYMIAHHFVTINLSRNRNFEALLQHQQLIPVEIVAGEEPYTRVSDDLIDCEEGYTEQIHNAVNATMHEYEKETSYRFWKTSKNQIQTNLDQKFKERQNKHKEKFRPISPAPALIHLSDLNPT